MLRIVAGLLLFAFGALFAISRLDFTSSDPESMRSYIARHSIYWLILAGAAGAKWIFIKFFPNSRQ